MFKARGVSHFHPCIFKPLCIYVTSVCTNTVRHGTTCALFTRQQFWCLTFTIAAARLTQDRENESRRERRKMRLVWEMMMRVLSSSSPFLSLSLSPSLFISSWLEMKEHVEQRHDDSAWWRGNKRGPMSFLSPPPPRSLSVSYILLFSHPFIFSLLLLTLLSSSYSLDIFHLVHYSLLLSSALSPSSLILLRLSSFRSFRALCWNRICHCVFGDR